MFSIKVEFNSTECPACGASIGKVIITDSGITIEHKDMTQARCEFVPGRWVVEPCQCDACMEGTDETQ